MGSIQARSSIDVMDPKELEEVGVYQFRINPNSELAAGSIFIIALPPELGIQTSSICLEPSSEGRCIVKDPSTLKIEDLLLSDYTDMSIYIEFSLLLKNPKDPIAFSALMINVSTMDSGELNTYHRRSINLANPGFYEPHKLINVYIIPESEITVTNNKYNFTFTNSQYAIPAGASIQVIFSGDVQYVGTNPPNVSSLLNINPPLTSAFTYPYLTIANGFPYKLNANNNLQFVVDNILNPYGIMQTTSFQIFIYINGNINYKVFEKSEGLTISTNYIREFPTANIVPATLRTSERVNYTFTLGIYVGALNTSHLIEFLPPSAISKCYKETLISNSPVLSIGAATDNSDGSIDFQLASTIIADSEFPFTVECINPYTTRPSDSFSILGRSNFHEFYRSTVNIPDMNIINNYNDVIITRTFDYPKVLNRYNFAFIGSNEDQTTAINQIVVEISGLVMDPSYVVTRDFGIVAPGFSYSLNEGIITLEGITGLNPNYKFHIENLRNPLLADVAITLSIATLHSDGYIGENRTISLTISCDFPCKTCPQGASDNCSSCFPLDHEVFEGGTSLYMISSGECLGNCPPHTYIYDDICIDCHSTCDRCDWANFDNCTKCYPHTNTFLYINQCISPPCPLGYIQNEQNWTCISIYIYIYIYIYI